MKPADATKLRGHMHVPPAAPPIKTDSDLAAKAKANLFKAAASGKSSHQLLVEALERKRKSEGK
jgi:hypothetical protein